MRGDSGDRIMHGRGATGQQGRSGFGGASPSCKERDESFETPEDRRAGVHQIIPHAARQQAEQHGV
jgi:hypothetical protein